MNNETARLGGPFFVGNLAIKRGAGLRNKTAPGVLPHMKNQIDDVPLYLPADLCLGVTLAGVNTLIVIGLFLAFA